MAERLLLNRTFALDSHAKLGLLLVVSDEVRGRFRYQPLFRRLYLMKFADKEIRLRRLD